MACGAIGQIIKLVALAIMAACIGVALWSAIEYVPGSKCWVTDVAVPLHEFPNLITETKNLLLQPAGAADLAAGHPPGIPVLKVADFGFARWLPSQSMAETLCGSPDSPTASSSQPSAIDRFANTAGKAASSMSDSNDSVLGKDYVVVEKRTVEINALADAVQWFRQRFNECFDKADFAKSRCTQDEIPESAAFAEKLIYDRALELSRAAAVNELRGESPADCETAYETALWMLYALLDETLSGSSTPSTEAAEEDRVTVERFIKSIGARLAALRKKIAPAAGGNGGAGTAVTSGSTTPSAGTVTEVARGT
ncbi:hypothetical protein JCM11251_002352 [Rhodosporidiobolus azoricus]